LDFAGYRAKLGGDKSQEIVRGSLRKTFAPRAPASIILKEVMSRSTPRSSAQPAAPAVQLAAGPQPSRDPASAKQSFWRVLTKFDHSKVSAYRALRNAAGVALPLVAGYAMGMPRGGLVVASGALNVSYSDGSDPYPRRAKRMIASAVLCAAAVFAGAISGPYSALAIAMATVWAFAAGMLVALGTTASDLGVISLVSLLIYAAQPLTPHQAIISGLLALGGGLFQAALSVALWPVQRYEPERRALAKFFAQLANAAEAPMPATAAPPASLESDEVQGALGGLAQDDSVEAVRFRSLLNQAERIRLGLLMLARLRLRMERESAGHAAAAIAGEALKKAAAALRAVEGLLTTDNFSNARIDFADMRRFSQQLDKATRQPPSAFFLAVARDAGFQIDALAGQLRAVTDLAAHSTPIGQEAFDRQEARQPWRLRFRGWYATLRANVSLESSAFRHAIRLAVIVAIGEALGRGFYWRRSYWLPMTVVLVLKPEFTTTFSRGMLRVAGTIVGLLLATALFHFLPITVTSQILLIFAFTFLLRWIGPANYGIFGIAVSALVVLLIAIAGIAPKDVIWARGINTAGGGALALLAYWVWPTWERTRVAERAAIMLEAYNQYFHALAEIYVSGGKEDDAGLESLRLASRVARSNLEASIERLASEPGTTAQQMTRLYATLATTHRFVHAAMALDAGWLQTARVPARPPFTMFATGVEKTLSLLVRALRDERVADKDFPNLREDHNRLVESGDSTVERYALVNVEADRITNSLNTLREQILDRSRSPYND
jgi:uncharacterized membrane protein YccC